MFFLLRCVFWLWVVFSTIFAQPGADGGTPRPQPASQRGVNLQPVVDGAQTWLTAAAERVADQCAQAPARCLSIAAQFSKLAANRGEATEQPVWQPDFVLRPTLSDIRIDTIPLPPRRPHFSSAVKAKPALEKTARREYLMDRARADAAF